MSRYEFQAVRGNHCWDDRIEIPQDAVVQSVSRRKVYRKEGSGRTDPSHSDNHPNSVGREATVHWSANICGFRRGHKEIGSEGPVRKKRSFEIPNHTPFIQIPRKQGRRSVERLLTSLPYFPPRKNTIRRRYNSSSRAPILTQRIIIGNHKTYQRSTSETSRTTERSFAD